MSIFDRIFKRTDSSPQAAIASLPALPPSSIHLDAWENAVTGLGTFNGASKHDAFVSRCTKHYSEADAIYSFSGIMARIITLEPTTCFAKGFSVVDLQQSDKASLKNYLTNLDANSKMGNAATLARQYGGAAVYMKIDDSLDPSKPVNINSIRSIIGLTVFDLTEVTVQSYSTDINSPYFGEPLIYQISSLGATFTVHASRILHFDAFPISRHMRISSMGNGGFSPSIIDRTWDAFSAYGSTNAYFRETIKKLTQGALKLSKIEDGLKTGNKATILNRLRILMQQMSTIGDVVLDAGAGEDYTVNSRNVQGFSDASQVFVDWLVAESSVPRSMLMLQTQGGLSDGSNDGDHKYWAKHCSSVQANQYSPLAMKLLKYVFASKLTPVRNAPSPFAIEWPPIAQMTEKEDAEIYSMRATGRAADVAAQVISPVEARQSPDVMKAYGIDANEEPEIPSYSTGEVGT